MKKIVIGSHNLGKISEFKEIFAKAPLLVTSLEELNIKQIPDEIGETFAANSLLKAKFFANLTALPVLADDGGLEIPVLNNYPGVKTRHWESKIPLTDNELVEKILFKLKKYSGNDRKANLKTVITVYNPLTDKYLQAEGILEGEIAQAPCKNMPAGYPIRSILFIPKAGKFYSQFTKRDKLKYSHRHQIIAEILKDIILLI
jgi:XTP/dITP diphosphohydrolase